MERKLRRDVGEVITGVECSGLMAISAFTDLTWAEGTARHPKRKTEVQAVGLLSSGWRTGHHQANAWHHQNGGGREAGAGCLRHPVTGEAERAAGLGAGCARRVWGLAKKARERKF